MVKLILSCTSPFRFRSIDTLRLMSNMFDSGKDKCDLDKEKICILIKICKIESQLDEILG